MLALGPQRGSGLRPGGRGTLDDTRPGHDACRDGDAAAWLNEHGAANLPTATSGSPFDADLASVSDPIAGIHIHGLGSTRAGTLRGVLAATELGYTSLVVSYRNTAEGPRVGTGRTTLGDSETNDVDEAIGYAVRRGAQRIVLFGWSMGAAIALQLAGYPRHQGLIAALVLDSPVLDWTEVIKTNCTRSGLPAPAAHLAIPWLTLAPLARTVGLPGSIPLRSFDWTSRAAELATPTLILHGTRDDSVPIRLSQALRDARPDLVELEAFDADHTLCWNSDPDRWHEAVTTWLKARVPS